MSDIEYIARLKNELAVALDRAHALEIALREHLSGYDLDEFPDHRELLNTQFAQSARQSEREP